MPARDSDDEEQSDDKEGNAQGETDIETLTTLSNTTTTVAHDSTQKNKAMQTLPLINFKSE